MKQIIITALLSVLLLASGNAVTLTNVPPDGPKFTITIEIGRKPSCIMAWALCNVTFGGFGLTANAESFPASGGSGGGGGGSWRIYIPRDNFAKYYPSYLIKLDGKSTVTFVESFTVPADVKKALGSMKDLVIQGNVAYPLTYENGEFVITFPL